ncbi:hypothetical protein [Paenibacillus sp. VTT E-133291]|uniref:hypothetical protein n=1 Tax=Paenibacillus sp. VTT E-133291 TaxID=1986223 RepID=UPI000BA1352A|nr:hypothetical protein [Paenibacillus sp. VTT E-133291]OZQ97385.1 hypothetical protein CA598_06215 [Paenibacillus sp. VTT E-133291]
MKYLDKYIPLLTRLYNPVFFFISIFGCLMMYLNLAPSGFGIPFIVWLFAATGHLVSYYFRKRVGYLSLMACVFSVDWMVGSFLTRAMERLRPDSESIVPRLLAAIAFLFCIVIMLMYLKVMSNIQSPVAREYTWEDFKYDIQDRNERWNDRMRFAQDAAEQGKENIHSAIKWIRNKIKGNKNKVPAEVSLIPADENVEETFQATRTETDQDVSEVKHKGFIITFDLPTEDLPPADSDLQVPFNDRSHGKSISSTTQKEEENRNVPDESWLPPLPPEPPYISRPYGPPSRSSQAPSGDQKKQNNPRVNLQTVKSASQPKRLPDINVNSEQKVQPAPSKQASPHQPSQAKPGTGENAFWGKFSSKS